VIDLKDESDNDAPVIDRQNFGSDFSSKRGNVSNKANTETRNYKFVILFRKMAKKLMVELIVKSQKSCQ
jgi:hypothetical protein